MPLRKFHNSHDTERPVKRRRLANKSRPATARTPLILNHPPTTVLDVFVFGNGEAGELGLGPTVTEALRPTLNPFLSRASSGNVTGFEVVQVACGGMHSIALTRDNQIVTWGVNDNGALGRETAWETPMKDSAADDSDDSDDESMLNPRESTPTAIPADAFLPGTTFVQVAAGDSCSFVLTTTGTVYGWGTFRTPDGKEVFSQRSNRGKNYVQRQPTPALISGLSNITQLAVGANHALALDIRGRVWAWGCAHQNQLGCRLLREDQSFPHDPVDGRLLQVALVPRCVRFPGNVRIQYIASGEYHAFAIDTHDRVWAWGLDAFGETGADPTGMLSGRNEDQPEPPLIEFPTEVHALANQSVVALAGSGHHSVAVTADGICLAWGRLDAGQLGIPFEPGHPAVQTDDRGRPRICLLPTAVPLKAKRKDSGDGSVSLFESCLAAACGTEHTLMVTHATSHTAFGAGFNEQGQLGLGANAPDEVTTAQQIGGTALKGRSLTWAGAGGQFSMLAGLHTNR